MKSILLILLLSCLAVAAPLDPPNSPGRELTSEEVARELDRAEAGFRRQHDQAGLLQVECLRLEPLLSEYAPSCPARIRALEAVELVAGPARARVYWVRGLYAGLARQPQRCLELEKLALLEPGVPLAWKAEWLAKMVYQSDTAAHLNWVDRQLLLLLDSEPGPAVAWNLLEAQLKVAQRRDQNALKESLLRAQLVLAEKQHWPLEQLRTHLALHEIHWKERVYWDRALAVARSQGRDEWTRLLFRYAPSEAHWKAAVSGLRAPRSRVDKARDWLGWKVRRQFDQLDQRVTCLRDLIEDDRRRGQVEMEVRHRHSLYFALRDAARLGESLRELEAAVQFRLDHPPPESFWVDRDLSLGSLGHLLVSELQNTGHRHQAQAWCERAINENWAVFPEDRTRLLRTAAFMAEQAGDTRQAGDYARQLAGQLPAGADSAWLPALEWLAEKAPEEERSGYLRQAQTLIMQQHRTANPVTKSVSLYTMERLSRQQSGTAQTLQFWLNQYEQARENNDARALEVTAGQLLQAYRNADRMEEFKELAQSLLHSPDTPKRTRLSCLSGCGLLATHHDPLALQWAEEYLRLGEDYDRRWGLTQKATVLTEFGRIDEALTCLDQARKLSPEFAEGVESTRVSLLWKAGRHAQAFQVLDGLIEAGLGSEDPGRAVNYIRTRANRSHELHQEWEALLERRLLEYQKLGEIGEWARDYLLGEWLSLLAKDQEWQRGREVLARYPWRKPGNDNTTKKFRKFPEWRELFPEEKAPALSAAGATQTLPQVLDELRLQQPELGQLLTLRSTNLKSLQKQLQPQDTLVTYCQQGGQLYLLALRPQGGFFRKYAVNESELQASIKRYLDSLRSDQIGDAETSLFQLLLEPVLSEDPRQRLFLVPNGTLWQLPFGALRDPKGRSAASRAELVMLGSGDLLRLADGDWKPYRLTHPLAIGAPPAADLPGAYAELGEVAKLLPGCQLRRGEEATLSSLYERDQQWGLLHFASHAHYRSDRPVESDIQLHDGKLQIKQLSQLSLSDHALVALSVCQGGASKGQQLDEPVTLATGFSAAGAETVVANLWPVDDEVARLFFTAFYRELAGGGSPGSSFREAQELCRQTYPKARDWAGFFLLGNPG